MMRATGFLLGTLLVLAVFLLALSGEPSPTPVRVVTGSEVDLPAATTGPIPAAVVPVENAVDNVVPPASDSPPHDEEPRPDVNVDGIELTPQSWNQSMANYETAFQKNTVEPSRYRVWSPFRSQWAAQGFARRLMQATDVPVEVVNEGPGNFQVVFSYRDDGERLARIKRIESVTGLELE